MTQALALDDAGSIPSLRTQLAQAPTALAKLDVAKSILAAREEAAKPAPLVANDVAVPLEPLLVEWTPRFTSSIPPEFRTLPRRNQHLLFSTGVDLGMMQLTATATFEGEKSRGADRAAEDLAKIKACEAAGYTRQRVKMAGLNILGFVFVKDGLAVTPAGAAKLAGVDAPAPAVSKVRVTKGEARDAYDALSYRLTSYQQHHDSELLRVDLSEHLLPLVEAVKSLVQRGWPEGVSDPAYLLEKADGTIARQDRLKADGLTKDMGRGEARDYLRNNGLTPEQIEAVLAMPSSVEHSGPPLNLNIPSYTMAYLNQAIGEANLSAQRHDGAWVKSLVSAEGLENLAEPRGLTADVTSESPYAGGKAVMGATLQKSGIRASLEWKEGSQSYALRSIGDLDGRFDANDAVLSRLLDAFAVWVDATAKPVSPSVAEFIPTEDQTYLQSIIDGTIDLLDPSIFDKLEPMFTKYADDAEMMGMLNRAAEAYTAAAVAAAKGV